MGKYLDGNGLSHLISKIKTALAGKADSSALGDLLPKQPASADLPVASTSNTLFPLVLGNTFANNGKVSYLTKANCQSWLGMDDYLPLTGGTLSGSVQISNASNKNFSEKDTTTDLLLANNGYSSGTRYMEWLAYDKNGYIPGGLTVQVGSSGTVTTLVRCRNYKTGDTTAYSCNMTMSVTKAGAKSTVFDSYVGSKLSTTAKVLDAASHGLSSNVTVGQLYCVDGNTSWTGIVGSNLIQSDDNTHPNAVTAYLGTRNRVYNSSESKWEWITNYITVGVDKNGTKYYSVSNAANFRSAIGLGSLATKSSITSSDISGSLTQNTSGSAAKLTTARSLYVALGTAYDSSNPVTFDGSAAKALPVSGTLPINRGGTNMTQDYTNNIATGVVFRAWGHSAYLRVEVTKNFTDGYSAFTLGTVPSGYRPAAEVVVPAMVYDTGRCCVIIVGTDGVIKVGQLGGSALGNHKLVGTASWVI